MVFQKTFFPFFERQISKFDRHMVLNWATQPLTRHLFPVVFFSESFGISLVLIGGLGPGALDIWDNLMEGIVTLGIQKQQPKSTNENPRVDGSRRLSR